MQHQSLIAYIFIVLFGITILMAQANKEREQFTDLLQKRKHLTGYWVGKRYAVASDEDLNDSGKSNLSSFCCKIYIIIIIISR
jgi:Ni,Fe-hydrogenase I cytochrome b subunit